MKITSVLVSFLVISLSTAYAHCPFKLAPEKACFMLDQNVIYIYDIKSEHDGPYKNLKEYSLKSISAAGKKLSFTTPSRGIIKIDSSVKLQNVEIELEKDHNMIKLVVKSE